MGMYVEEEEEEEQRQSHLLHLSGNSLRISEICVVIAALKFEILIDFWEYGNTPEGPGVAANYNTHIYGHIE